MPFQAFRYGRLLAFVTAAAIQTAGASAYRTSLPDPPNFRPTVGNPFPVRTAAGRRPVSRQLRPGGGGARPDVALADRFDRDKNGWLDADERREARTHVESTGLGRRGRSGYAVDPVTTGPMLRPDDVKRYPASVSLYDSATLRTLFLEFENADWEQELIAFKETDIEVPATMRVDGRTYPHVGISFRGNSSFSGVPAGLKHSINVSIDAVHENQNLYGHRTLNLLNSHTDPTYLRSVLFFLIARDLFPAPRANYARVVINGESWGVFVNVEQFNKDFVRAHFDKSGDGTRWKVPGNPRGQGGLQYLGENAANYRQAFEIKSKDTPAAWAPLVDMTRLLNDTPLPELERRLGPVLDIDGTLRFLAVDNALVNSDGYWARASDYALYRHPSGRFHLIPHDVNEGFPAPGAGRGGRGGDASLDPLVGLDDWTKPLRSKLLSDADLQRRYLGYVRQVADEWLDWGRLGPIARRYQALIRLDMETDVRKLDSLDAFDTGLVRLEAFVARRQASLLAATAPR